MRITFFPPVKEKKGQFKGTARGHGTTGVCAWSVKGGRDSHFLFERKNEAVHRPHLVALVKKKKKEKSISWIVLKSKGGGPLERGPAYGVSGSLLTTKGEGGGGNHLHN